MPAHLNMLLIVLLLVISSGADDCVVAEFIKKGLTKCSLLKVIKEVDEEILELNLAFNFASLTHLARHKRK